jgi:hypothetical protein
MSESPAPQPAESPDSSSAGSPTPTPAESPTPSPEGADGDTAVPERLNRAARRGKARGQDGAPAPDHGFGRRARPAQGRRFNPIRRTG